MSGGQRLKLKLHNGLVVDAKLDNQPTDIFEALELTDLWFKLRDEGWDIQILVDKSHVQYQPRIGDVFETPTEQTVLAYRKATKKSNV